MSCALPTMPCLHSHVGEETEEHRDRWILEWYKRMPPSRHIFPSVDYFLSIFVVAVQLMKRTTPSMKSTEADSLDETAWWSPSSLCDSHS